MMELRVLVLMEIDIGHRHLLPHLEPRHWQGAKEPPLGLTRSQTSNLQSATCSPLRPITSVSLGHFRLRSNPLQPITTDTQFCTLSHQSSNHLSNSVFIFKCVGIRKWYMVDLSVLFSCFHIPSIGGLGRILPSAKTLSPPQQIPVF